MTPAKKTIAKFGIFIEYAMKTNLGIKNKEYIFAKFGLDCIQTVANPSEMSLLYPHADTPEISYLFFDDT